MLTDKWKKLQNGSDIRGVALEGIEGQHGAAAVLDEQNIGSLTEGKKADLIVINPRSAGMLPLHDTIANLVTSMHSSNVESTMCDGKWLMRERKLLTLDEEAIYTEAQKRADDIRTRAGIVIPPRFKMN